MKRVSILFYITLQLIFSSVASVKWESRLESGPLGNMGPEVMVSAVPRRRVAGRELPMLCAGSRVFRLCLAVKHTNRA